MLDVGIGYEEADYIEAHNLIYGVLEYAEEAGIQPHKDFRISEYILEPDNKDIPLMEFEFGHSGVRELVIGPEYMEMTYIPVLEKNVPGEFVVTGYSDRYYDQDSDEDECLVRLSADDLNDVLPNYLMKRVKWSSPK